MVVEYWARRSFRSVRRKKPDKKDKKIPSTLENVLVSDRTKRQTVELVDVHTADWWVIDCKWPVSIMGPVLRYNETT